MKKLPCPRCGDAVAPGGGPVIIGRLSTTPLRYPCRGCRRPATLTAQQWALLPELPDEDSQRHLSSEALRLPTPGTQPMQLDIRVASGLLSPTAGRLVT